MIDINVWLALTWDLHPQHATALRWYDSLDEAGLIFCRFTMLGLLRLLTNRLVMGGSTISVSDALQLFDRWMQDPRVDLLPEPAGTDERFRQALSLHATEFATNAIADCYLAAFAESSGAQLVTFDRGLATTARVRHVAVVLLGPDTKKPAGRHGQKSR